MSRVGASSLNSMKDFKFKKVENISKMVCNTFLLLCERFCRRSGYYFNRVLFRVLLKNTLQEVTIKSYLRTQKWFVNSTCRGSYKYDYKIESQSRLVCATRFSHVSCECESCLRLLHKAGKFHVQERRASHAKILWGAFSVCFPFFLLTFVGVVAGDLADLDLPRPGRRHRPREGQGVAHLGSLDDHYRGGEEKRRMECS